MSMPQPVVHNRSTSENLLKFLLDPETYPHHPRRVELRETHISWVFLAGAYAYKLKKPVQFDFLDFSTPEKRYVACHNELDLNRRLSPHVYRAVVPIRRTASGRLQLGGDGPVVDWLVKMRRLDDSRTLQALLESDQCLADEWKTIESLAEDLANFFTSQAPLTIKTPDFRAALQRHVLNNRDDLVRLTEESRVADLVLSTHSAQLRFLAVHQGLFDDRVRDGRIVDGHGDLRPEHIYLYPRPLVIDCIEFNAEYRRNDVIDELAFLAMECERLGNQDVGKCAIDAYVTLSEDRVPQRLVTFYKAYRACVRAKVAGLRSRQVLARRRRVSEKFEGDYLHLAARYARELGPPLVLIVGGLMGSGKSTLAEALAEFLSAELISTDVIRQELPRTVSQRFDFGEGPYSKESRLGVYATMAQRAQQACARNRTIILDGTFSVQSSRREVERIGHSLGAQTVQIQCTCPREVAMARIQYRMFAGSQPSEARPELFDDQAREAGPPIESLPLIEIDTLLPLSDQREQIIGYLRKGILAI